MRPVPPTLQGQYAGFVTRLAAFVVDALAIITVGVVIALATQVVLAVFGLECVLTAECAALTRPIQRQIGMVLMRIQPIAALAVTPILTITYLVFAWTLTGRTIGKALMGVRIVPMDGSRMTTGRSLRRLVGYAVSIIPLFLGFAWIVVDDRRQGFHDKIAGTCVVYAWEARVNHAFLDKLDYSFGRRGGRPGA